MPFIWPTWFLLLTVAMLIVASIAPWLMTRRLLLASVVLCVAATATWWGYEAHLHSIAKPGDPLIRIDWFLLLPLFCVAWLQAIYFGARCLIRTQSPCPALASPFATTAVADPDERQEG